MEKVFKALASEPRRHILNHLIEAPMTVGEVAANFDMAMPSVSKHLAVLREAGLVREQKRGQYVLYSLVGQVLTGAIYDFLAPFCPDAERMVANRAPQKRKTGR